MFRIFSPFRRWFGAGATRSERGDLTGQPDGYTANAAASVNEDTALQISAFWACTKLLTEVFASLPLGMYEKGELRKRVTNHPILTLLTESPNSRMTPCEFFETMQLNLVLHGNCYARIARRNDGSVVALWPLPAQNVQPILQPNGSVVYHWYHDNHVSVITDRNILHVRLFGNGLIGLSPLSYARNAVGLSLATENYAAKFYTDGGKPSGVLYTDADLSKQQRQTARENFSEVVTEKEESRRLLVLPLGFKYQATQINPVDMEVLETRRYQTADICRFMGNIPPVLVCETSGTTTLGSSIEHILLGWYRLGLNPYAQRWEQALAKKLLSPAERQKYAFDFDFDALTRGDSKSQIEMIKASVGGPILTPNEGRRLRNLPPIDGGDILNPSPHEGRKASDKQVINE